MSIKIKILAFYPLVYLVLATSPLEAQTRERISIDKGWRFYKYESPEKTDNLIYDVRPEVKDEQDNRAADAKPSEAVAVVTKEKVLKRWILPTGNAFLSDPANRRSRPLGKPGEDFPFVKNDFNDSSWESIDLPHDWAIKGPFNDDHGTGWLKDVGGSLGRLPSPGVAWYRKKFDLPTSDKCKSIFLDVDGAMSYAMVWLNGHLVGGWPYGYSSWRVDLTPFIVTGGDNQLAIRLDNPPASSRWYPGGGIYRSVWLTKTSFAHVAQWGTFIKTHDVSKSSANVDLEVTIDNDSEADVNLDISTQIFALNSDGKRVGEPVADIAPKKHYIKGKASIMVKGSTILANPKLWGPPPQQTPHRYIAVTTISDNGQLLDVEETKFGIRDLRFDPAQGIIVNGEHIFIRGANQHHDLGPLGAAFNIRAAERQLEMLQEAGCNAIRLAHNPPAPELLDLTDKMGFLVIDEIFDVWERKKTALDFHLLFPDWHEQDLRALIRRDKNHPSVILWSIGNEVGEQYTGDPGAKVAKMLHDIAKDEDPTRLTTTSMNFAKPNMPLPAELDVICLNYQGEGIRHAPAYAGLKGITTPPSFPAFHEKFPNKVIISSENAATLSSRGEYQFPVNDGNGAPVKDRQGGDPTSHQVSAYELYTVEFGSSPDIVFASEDQHPCVAGGFVWSGWDYLGEPSPYYSSRSSYFGLIDLAGFKKDRFYLYQSRWRPDFPMAHILPHWTWPDRVGLTTPVHVFTSGDEAELFLNGKSLGRKKKSPYEYRLRWDEVKYEPGELKVIAYKNGNAWAENSTRTTSTPAKLQISPDRSEIHADSHDLSFVTVRVSDKNGLTCPRSKNLIKFRIKGPGEIVATDNGDPTRLEPFQSHECKAFNGLCLVIVRSKSSQSGTIELVAESEFLESTSVSLRAF